MNQSKQQAGKKNQTASEKPYITHLPGSYSMKSDSVNLKKSIEEQSKVVDKIKNDQFKLQGRVQHIFDYISALEDRIEESDRRMQMKFKEASRGSPLR